jgi:hypothetical protein
VQAASDTNPYKELLSQKTPVDFGQGVAMKTWHSAATDPLSSSENAAQNRLGFFRRTRFKGVLWGIFRALIAGALDQLKVQFGAAMGDILRHIEHMVKQFFEQVMQMDSFTLRLEAMPEKGCS